jgi:hypothetical protein
MIDETKFEELTQELIQAFDALRQSITWHGTPRHQVDLIEREIIQARRDAHEFKVSLQGAAATHKPIVERLEKENGELRSALSVRNDENDGLAGMLKTSLPATEVTALLDLWEKWRRVAAAEVDAANRSGNEELARRFSCVVNTYYTCEENLRTKLPGHIPTYDLDQKQWKTIKQAAMESKWIPPEYFKNDWVSDVCQFLRTGAMPQRAHGDAWIRCEDQLPSDGEEVFFVRLKTVHRGLWSLEDAPHFVPTNGCRYWHPQEGVTHWMPSPTPKAP